MGNPVISIIVPVYNSEKYLDRCINSIINQTYKNLEIILIDDGSSDNSGEICDIYKKNDFRIKVIHKKNGGVSSARNSGIDYATGEYITFIDSDDWIEKNTVETLINLLKYEYNYDLVIYGFVKEKEEKEETLEDINFIYNKAYNNKVEICNKLKELIQSEAINSPWNKLYKRSIICDNNIRFNKRFSIGEDLLFNIEYFVNIRTMYMTSKKLYHYNIGQIDSLTTKYIKDKHIQLLDINDIIEKLIMESESYKGVIESIKYIRVKNITSCLLDIHRKESELSYREKIIYIDNIINKEKENINLFRSRIRDKQMMLLSMIYVNLNKYIIYLFSYGIYLVRKKRSLKGKIEY